MMRICVCLLLLALLGPSMFGPVDGRRTRFKPKPKPKDKTGKSVEDITPAKDINIHQMSGKWYLLTVASRCEHLLKKGFKVEGTTIFLTAPASANSPLKLSTLTKHNYQCWEIQQHYETTKSSGRFLLKGNMPAMNIEISVIDTDYSSYAVLLYKRMNKITLKLYGRSTQIPDAIVDKFEEIAKKHNMGLDVIFQFPDYGKARIIITKLHSVTFHNHNYAFFFSIALLSGFCESGDKEHTLVESSTTVYGA
ncbi:hypothetical protein NFI96_015854 [Prochilodus magdalenae]|nr:hypothetical protein NFI96_015854 [Prochilodus magdalenae]